MERALKNYLEELKSYIASMVYSEGDVSFEDKYTEYCIEVLETIGKTEGARVIYYRHPSPQYGTDWQINGYCLRDLFEDNEDKKNKVEYFETLDLFITYFNTETYNYSIKKDDYTKAINQIKRFIDASLKGYIDYIDSAHTELKQLIKIIGAQGQKFDRINVFFFINGFSNHHKDKIKVRDTDVYIHTWDVARLFKIYESNSIHEPVEIEFEKFISGSVGLPCIKVPTIDELYDCYLAIVPGKLLAQLYKEYSTELLESNVRAFLGQAGKFNKGIRETIRTKPHMFLPYNNGITATSEKVETKLINNQLYISKLNDFQIVNGGQTTASLYHTQKKYKDTDLSKIFVQMKLTVIKDQEQKNIEVPNIARYANSQNKVSELDLTSNNPFFIQIENLSRKKHVPSTENRNLSTFWYFERVNGQYREALNKQTPAQQRAFKLQNPTHQKFVKSDISKFINLWDLEPHIVARGSQKSFVHYTKKINVLVEKNKLPGENFYKKLIANAIIFKTVDKLFGRKNIDAIGDTSLKSFSVAYTISYFHFLTNNRFDLWKIYADQFIDDILMVEFKKLLVFVYEHLVREANQSLISEYAKRESSWLKLKDTPYAFDFIKIFSEYFISDEERVVRETEKEITNSQVEDALNLNSQIRNLGMKFWDGFKKYIERNKSSDFEWSRAFDLVKKLKENKNLRQVDLSFGKKVLDFVAENPNLINEIKLLSQLEEKEVVDIKFIYDKLQLIPKEQWKRIIDFASQTNIFEFKELSNIKAVHSSLYKKAKVKEQALIKAYESILKLKRFGINI
jgi:hypothetical protein